jgi:hypothetical protein
MPSIQEIVNEDAAARAAVAQRRVNEARKRDYDAVDDFVTELFGDHEVLTEKVGRDLEALRYRLVGTDVYIVPKQNTKGRYEFYAYKCDRDALSVRHTIPSLRRLVRRPADFVGLV